MEDQFVHQGRNSHCVCREPWKYKAKEDSFSDLKN